MKAVNFLKNRWYYAKVFFLQHRYYFAAGAVLCALGIASAVYFSRPRPPVTAKEFAEALSAGIELYGAQRYEEARERLIYPARQGYTQALLFLGKMYYYGRGVDRDFKQAYESFSKAADDFPEAQYFAASMVFRGEVRNKDKGTATKRLTAAAYRGHPAAQRDLGIYSFMSGDAGQAYYWLSLAAAGADAKAAEVLPEAAAKVSEYERVLLDTEIKGFAPRK